jgi:plastocyanin domain-containing protein
MNSETINILKTLSGISLIVLILIFIILSWILIYHWNKYEISIVRTNLIKKVYFIVSGGLLLILLIIFLNL